MIAIPVLSRWFGVLSCFLLVSGAAIADAAGRFQFVLGEVQVLRPSGESRPALKGTEVFEGETIRSAGDAQAQLLMADQALLALRPDSTLTIESYRYNGQSDGSERSFLALLKGGFRALTGAIGSVYRENYRIRTPNATIGIRGTDHEPFFIPAPAAGEIAVGVPGTYDKVNSGAVVLRTEAGQVELGANEVGFVGLVPGAAPSRLSDLPVFMRAPHGGRGGERDPESGNSPPPRDKPPRQNAPPENRPALPPPAPRPLSEGFDPRNPNANTVLAPLGYALAAGDVGEIVVAGSGAAVAAEASGTVILLDQKGALRAIHQSDFSYVASDNKVSAGSMEVDGLPVRWGIYEGGVIVDKDGARRPRFVHYVAAPSTTSLAHLNDVMPRPGMSLSMQAVDGNPPITEGGAIGGKISLNVGLSNIAGRPMLDRYDLNVVDAESRRWNAALLTPLSMDDFRSNASAENLRVNCSGCNVGVGSGRAHGVVVGNPVPVGMVTSFDLSAGRAAVVGSVFAR